MYLYNMFLKPSIISTVLLFMLIKLDVMAESRVALVIGNSDYENGWSDLPNAGNDADDIAEVLKKYNFKVFNYKNLTILEMEKQVDNFMRYLAPNAIGLFYYAGHGVQIDMANYLVPVDVGSSNIETTVKRTSFPAKEIVKQMQARSSGLNIVILDACRNNPFASSRGLSGLSAMSVQSRGITGIAIHQAANSSTASGIIIGYATAPNQTASENPDERNGLFTKHLLQAIKTKGLTIEYVLKQTATQVAKESNNEQIPWRDSSLLGEDFCFTPCGDEVKPLPPHHGDEEVKPLPSPPVVPEPINKQRKWIEPSLVFQDSLQDGGLGPEMVVIPAGRFKMGDIQNNGDRDEKPIHDVTLKQFAVGRYEVTVNEFQQFVQTTNYQTSAETNGKGCYVRRSGIGWGWREKANWQNSYIEKQGVKHPVVCVNWNDAIAYVEWLQEQTGQPYSLPSEAQWEYMARSNTHSDYWWGNQMDNNQANCWKISRWHQSISPVGSFLPNSFKIYDTIGNVWEWVTDNWHNQYNGAPINGEVWQEGGDNTYRILRGGSWVSQPLNCRVSERFKAVPTRSTARIGFRVAIKELN